MTAAVAAQAGLLAVPDTQGLDPFRLLLAEGVAEVIQKAVGIRLGQGEKELVAILDKLRLAIFNVLVQDNVSQAERRHQELRSRARFALSLDGHYGFGLERCAGDLAGYCV